MMVITRVTKQSNLPKVKMNLFKLNRENFLEIEETNIDSEKELQNWIEKNPQLLDSDICILGKEVPISGRKGRIDLLAINQEGNIIIIETKKYESPDDLMGQVARYRNGIKKWDYDEKNKWKEISKNKYNININFNSNPQIYLIANDFDDDIVDCVENSEMTSTSLIKFFYFKSKDEEFLLFNEIANNISRKISSGKLKRNSSIEGLNKANKITKMRGATPRKEYYLLIIETLLEKSGKSTEKEVFASIEQKMSKSFNTLDLEILSDGYTKRWEKNAAFARYEMTKQGLLNSNSPRGVWEISEKGRQEYEKLK